MALRPLQQPMPPFWYGSSNTTGAAWSGEHGMHFVANGPTDYAKVNIDAYRRRSPSAAARRWSKPEFRGGAAIGALRHIVIAETDEEARKIAKPNVDYHVDSLNWLRKKHAKNEAQVRGLVPRGVTFEEWEKDGMAIAGSPATVRGRDRAADRQARHQLSAHLSVLRHADARAGDALARADAHRGDAEDREIVTAEGASDQRSSMRPMPSSKPVMRGSSARPDQPVRSTVCASANVAGTVPSNVTATSVLRLRP